MQGAHVARQLTTREWHGCVSCRLMMVELAVLQSVAREVGEAAGHC
jgi:hypothetical protein